MYTIDPLTGDLEADRGDYIDPKLTITDSAGNALNVSAATFKLTVKSSLDDAIGAAVFQLTTAGAGFDVSAAASGIIVPLITESLTQGLAGDYVYDVEMVLGAKTTTIVRGALFRILKDVSEPGSPPAAPINRFYSPVSTREIVVDLTGQIGPYSTIQQALTYAISQASASARWTVKLLPGIYDLIDSLNGVSAQYVSIVGSGIDKTTIRMLTTGSYVTSGGRASNPVLDLTNSVQVRLQDLTLKHAGSTGTVSAAAINSSVGFQATNVRFESVVVAIDLQNTALPTPTDDQIAIFVSCHFIIPDTTQVSSDVIYAVLADCLLLNCHAYLGCSVGGPDLFFVSGCKVRIIGGDYTRRFLATQTTGSSGAVVAFGNTGNPTNFYALGARFYHDYSAADINLSTTDSACIDIRTTTTTAGDYTATFDGCVIEYESGALTSAREFCGLRVGVMSTNATLGTIRLVGTTIRDKGGSGGTNRADVIMEAGVVAAALKVCKNVFTNGCRISSWLWRSSIGSPSPNHANYMIQEPGVNYQTGTATFATAATVAVTLPVAFPTLGTDVSDYNVHVEASVNETFFVTAKTRTGFTLNSSNGASTATVRYTVTR